MALQTDYRGELSTKTLQRSCTIWNKTGYLQSLVGFMNNHHQNISAANLGAYLNHVEIDSWYN